MSEFINDEIIAEFLNESREYQERMDDILMDIEKSVKKKSDTDSETTNELFRIAHTIKGSAGFLEYSNINKLMHSMENVMSDVREGKLAYSKSMIETFLNVSERLVVLLDRVAENSTDDIDVDDLVAELEKIGSSKPAKKKKTTEKKAKSKKKSNNKSEGKKEDKEKKENKNDEAADKTDLFFDNSDIELIKEVNDKKEPFLLGNLLRKIDKIKSDKNEHKGIEELETIVWAMMSGSEEINNENISKALEILSSLITSKGEVDSNFNIENYEIAPGEKIFCLDILNKEAPELMDVKSELLKKRIDNCADMLSIKEDSKDGNSQGKIQIIIKTSCSKEDLLKEIRVSDIEITDIKLLKESEKIKLEKSPENKTKVVNFHKNTESTIRVDSKKLDKLMNLSEELVIVKSFYNRLSDKLKTIAETSGKSIIELQEISKNFESSTNRLSLLSDEIQSVAMGVRMVPVGNVLNKFKRVVRDLAKKSGKEVELDIFGEDTDLDKKVVDSLGEPLTHMIRNSIDHGIEPPDVRVEEGKPPTGKLTISAFNQGSSVILEVRDDGAGIDHKKVAEKAIKKGFITESELSGMTRENILDLIFLPGFSTKEKASMISGRGVGMDVVKNMINNVNGTLKLSSEMGKGTALIMNIPITLAVMNVILVKVMGFYYALPLENVIEITKIKKQEIISIEKRNALRIRNEVFFLSSLNELLNMGQMDEREEYTVILINSRNSSLGLIIDELVGEEEIVTKSLKDIIGNISGISGASILGEGDIALILDIDFLIRKGLGE